MLGKILISSTLIVFTLAELPANGPYAPSGWRPQGASFDLPNDFLAIQAQRSPEVELEIIKERVDYAGQLNPGNSQQMSTSNVYLPPSKIGESASINTIPNTPGFLSKNFLSPQLNKGEYFSQRQYELPLVDRRLNQYDVSQNLASGYTFPKPEEPFHEETEEIVKGEYFVLTPEKNLQKVSYKTSQTKEQAQNNAFTAVLKYTPVDKVEGPLYKYNEQGQLVRIYEK